MSGFIKYGFSLGRIYVLEKKMLSQNEIERLFEATNLSDMIQVLGESDYSFYLKKVASEVDIEEIFERYLFDFYELLDDLGSKEITSFFRYKYDFANIRNVVLGNTEQKMSNFGVIESDILLKLISQKNYFEVARLLDEYPDSVKKIFESDVEKAIQLLTFIYYEKLLSLAKTSKIPLLQKVTKIQIDLENIRIFLRKVLSKDNFINGGTLSLNELLSENANLKISDIYPALLNVNKSEINLFDKDLDNVIIETLRHEKYIPLSNDRLIAFLIAKELEVKNIRTLLLSGLNSFESEEIEINLRMVYA